MKNFDKTKIIYSILAAFLIGLFLFFSYSRVFDEFEYSTFDLRYRLRPVRSVDNNIVIVEISDDSISKLGKWPFPRKYHALLIKALESAGVRTIIFDIFFSESKEDDAEFAKAIADSGKVYLPYVFELDRNDPDTTRVHATAFAAALLKPLEKHAEGTGFVNVEPDIDGKIRRIPAFIEYEGQKYPHLTILAALNNLGVRFDEAKIIPGKKIIINDNRVIPLDENSSMLVDYPAKWGEAFRHYSYVDILQSYLSDVTGQKAAIDLSELKDTVCFIGLTATASPDAHPSTLQPLYPGIGVHTTVYDSVMRNKFLVRLNRWWNLVIIVFMWILTAYITEKSRKRFALASIFCIMIAYMCAAMVFFWPFGIWIDVFYPLVTMAAVYVIFTFIKYITETQKREIIEKELNIATDIQQSFLPKDIPGIGGIEIGVRMLTARQVGGDLYDIVDLGDGKLGIMLGDVSGKGVPAALYMAKVVSVFKAFAGKGEVVEVVKGINDTLVGEGSSSLFVTMTYMIFDTQINRTTYAIGGHMPTVLVEPDGTVKSLDVDEGMPLGMIEGDFSGGEYDYKKGSMFVLYSDGVSEAMNVNREMYGDDRLIELLRNDRFRSADEIVEAVHKAVNDFAGKAKQHDDITVMVIKT